MTKYITLIIIVIYGTILLFVPFTLSTVELVLQAQMLCILLALVFILSIISKQKFITCQNSVKITKVDVLVFLLMLYQGYNFTRVPDTNRDTVNNLDLVSNWVTIDTTEFARLIKTNEQNNI